MKCEKCGNIIEDKYICPICGNKKTTEEKLNNKNNNIPEANDKKITCHYCGLNIKADSVYCYNCGEKVKRHLLGEKKSFVICLISMLISIICINLFLFAFIMNLKIGLFLLILGIIAKFLTLVINIYAIINYPNSRYFKGLLPINVISTFI